MLIAESVTKTLRCKFWSTSGLLRHLKNKHSIVKPPAPPQTSIPSTSSSGVAANKRCSTSDDNSSISTSIKQRKITTFVRQAQQTTAEEHVAKLVAVDGISVNAVTKSEFIRESFSDKGFSLPKSPTSVMNMIYKQYEIVTTNIKNEIKALLKDGEKFSVSLDEYSSLRNRRYLNINIHTAGKHWNLGMITIVGRMTAERIVEAVELKL